MVVGDYKDLMRTTRVLLRPPDTFAERDVKQIIQRIKVQNKGIRTEEWRVVGDSRGKGFRTIALLIDDLSARSLQQKDWKVFLGADKVMFKVLTGKKEAKGAGAGNEGPGPSV